MRHPLRRVSRRAVALAAGVCATTFAQDDAAAKYLRFWPTACAEPPACPTLKLNTGAAIPQLGFGTYLTNGEELVRALVHAIRVGYRHIDTAAGYQNEPAVAQAIDEAGVPRSELFVTSKLWCSDHGARRTKAAIARSLSNLNTDYLDLYLIHAPDNQGETPEEIRRLRLESWREMEAAYRAGVLKAIGVSNFEPRHIDELLAGRPDAITPAVNQVELHPQLDQRATLDYCARKGIVVEAYGAIGADGLLEQPVVREVAARYGRTPAQLTLRHTLGRGAPDGAGVVVLAKSLTPSRIDENLRIFEWELMPADARALDQLARRDGRTYWDNSDVP